MLRVWVSGGYRYRSFKSDLGLPVPITSSTNKNIEPRNEEVLSMPPLFLPESCYSGGILVDSGHSTPAKISFLYLHQNNSQNGMALECSDQNGH
jgi:hypothetical protein